MERDEKLKTSPENLSALEIALEAGRPSNGALAFPAIAVSLEREARSPPKTSASRGAEENDFRHVRHVRPKRCEGR